MYAKLDIHRSIVRTAFLFSVANDYATCNAASGTVTVDTSCYMIVSASGTPNNHAESQAVCAPNGILAVLPTSALLSAVSSMVTASVSY